MYPSLKDKVAVITGSTSGIGLATAHELAKHGCHIVVNGLVTDSEGKEVAEHIAQKHNVSTLFDGADLSEPTAIARMMENAIERFGKIDILVNNAGIQHTEKLESFPKQKWDAIIAINLSSAFHTMQAALPVMQKNHWGRIINIASVHGLVGSANKSAYVAAKHGIVGLTKVAAIESANSGITVNSVCPGWVETPLINQQIADIAEQKQLSVEQAKTELITAKQPLAQMAKPENIGAFVAFLCSDAASSITGSALPIDGAWTAQ